MDATGEALLKTLRYEPFLIKPNLQELEELAERRLFTREEIIAQGKRLQEMGAKNVLISLAAEGAILLTAEGEILFGEAPRGKLVNAVGAGDSMVGGFVAGWVKTATTVRRYNGVLRQAVRVHSVKPWQRGKKFGDYMTKPSISFVRNVKKGCIFDENFGVVAKRKHCSWQKATG